MIIYKCSNKLNNKSYVGKTTRLLEIRKEEHIKNTSNAYFHNALRKYGEDSFTWEVLVDKDCIENELKELEIFFIKYYDTFKNGYNLTPGGEGGNIIQYLSEEEQIAWKNKISKTRIKNGSAKGEKIQCLEELERVSLLERKMVCLVKLNQKNLKVNSQKE